MTSEFAPLRNSLARKGTAPVVSGAKRNELHRRKEEYLKNPASGRTWKQVKERARATHD